MSVKTILEQVSARDLTRAEALELLQVKNLSSDYYEILKTANDLSRKEYSNRAYIFSQIGLNASPCPMNCKFCSMAADNYVMGTTFQKTMEDIGELKQMAKQLAEDGTDDLFLMTTADYPVDEFLAIGNAIRQILPGHVRLVANIGDFDLQTTQRLKSAGFSGAYHIRRLREGTDTDILPEKRLETMNSIKSAGLELYYCIEPIGPEHSYDEIADEMFRAKDYGVEAMAAMRRTPVPGTPLALNGMISSVELTKIGAVTRLVTRPSRSMNIHEITPMSLLGGVNQLYAEVGSNPRDRVGDTSQGRGYDVLTVKQLLKDAEYDLP